MKIKDVRPYQKSVRGPIGNILDNIFRFVPWLAIKYRISANTVTTLAFSFDLLAILFIINQWYIIAGIFIILSYVGDISDGTVARYEREYLKKSSKGYGQFLDEVLGTVGFSLVALFAGFSFGSPWLGLLAIFGILMMNITTAEAKLCIPNKQSISNKLQNHRFKNKFQIGFTCDVQRTLVALSVIFHSLWLLILFSILANGLWLSKFLVYSNE